MADREVDMKGQPTWTLKFFGGVGAVTGSKTLVDTGTQQVLVDCGLFQGYKQLRLKNWKPLPVRPADLDAVILTHAHIDHSGYLPILVKHGFRGRIYCTAPTADLCGVLLPDAGFLQEEEARLANKHGFSKHNPARPLFTREDAQACLRQLEPRPFGKPIQMEGWRFEFVPAGHILGAAMVRMATPSGKTLVFSGDLGRRKDILMPAPAAVRQADYLVLEATYGHRDHPTSDPEQVLADAVRRTIRRGGIVVIPSFTVGRAQALLFLLHRLTARGEIPDVPIYLNSPMAVQANKVTLAHASELRIGLRGARELNDVATFVNTKEASKALDKDAAPKIIIAGNGMATGGRVLHHLKTLLPGRKNTVLLVGYQAGGTRGAALAGGATEVKIHGQMVPVKASVIQMEELSAHADRSEIIQWLEGFKSPPQRTFLNHGEPEALDVLRRVIEQRLGWTVVVPESMEEFTLEA